MNIYIYIYFWVFGFENIIEVNHDKHLIVICALSAINLEINISYDSFIINGFGVSFHWF